MNDNNVESEFEIDAVERAKFSCLLRGEMLDEFELGKEARALYLIADYHLPDNWDRTVPRMSNHLRVICKYINNNQLDTDKRVKKAFEDAAADDDMPTEEQIRRSCNKCYSSRSPIRTRVLIQDLEKIRRDWVDYKKEESVRKNE